MRRTLPPPRKKETGRIDSEQEYNDTYRKHMRGLLDDIVMEYINNDTDVTPYDFISDLKNKRMRYGITIRVE